MAQSLIKEINEKDMTKRIDNSLPEWAKSLPGDNDSFEIDFGSPDSPKLMPQRYISDEQVSLEDMQIYDVVHGNKVIALVDRRGGNSSRKPIGTKEESENILKEETPLDEKENQNLEKNDLKKNEIEIGEYVLLVKGKAICCGDIKLVLKQVLKSLDEEDLSDEDFILLERKSLSVLTSFLDN